MNQAKSVIYFCQSVDTLYKITGCALRAKCTVNFKNDCDIGYNLIKI